MSLQTLKRKFGQPTNSGTFGFSGSYADPIRNIDWILMVATVGLSIIGAIILAFITEEGECVDTGAFGTCYEYATTRPYIEWAILSLFSALILSSFLYAFGSYVEARMKKQLESSSI